MSYLVKLYVDQIMAGTVSIEDVPARLKAAVEAALNEVVE